MKRTKNFHRYMVNKTFYWNAKISKIFGLSPYEYCMRSRQWKVTKGGVLLTIVNIIFNIFTLVPKILYQMYLLKIMHGEQLSIYSDMIQTLSNAISAICMLWVIHVNRDEMCNILKRYKDIDDDLELSGVRGNYETIFKHARNATLAAHLFLTIIIGIDFGLFITNNYNNTFVLIYWIGCMHSVAINILTTIKFNMYAYTIYKRFALLNDYAETLSQSKFKRLLNHKAAASYDRSKSIEDSTAMLVRIHDKLCNLTKSINSVYSFHILSMTCTTFAVLVMDIYSLYLTFTPNQNFMKNYWNMWSMLFWGLIFLISLFMTTFLCSTTANEANKTSAILHNIPIEECNARTKTIIEIFSLQRMQQKVEFTACGFFVVDFSTLYMVFGATTTYLIFLIQFEISGRNKAAQ